MIGAGAVRQSVAVGAALVLSAGIVCAEEQASPSSTSVVSIAISFKLDPRVFGGTYGGERWVSKPTYNSAAQPGQEPSVEAKVRGVDAGGRAVPISPDWVLSDPEMVVVSPVSGAQLDHVRLIVRRIGESKLRVVSQGVSKELLVTAKAVGTSGMVVTIAQ
jgi:hypothetical protein